MRSGQVRSEQAVTAQASYGRELGEYQQPFRGERMEGDFCYDILTGEIGHKS